MIRMLKEITEYGNNIKEEVEATLSEIKKNPQGTSSGGDEAEIQMNNLEHKEEKKYSIRTARKKKNLKMRIEYGASGTSLNTPTSKS